jgi:hypothetical protein
MWRFFKQKMPVAFESPVNIGHERAATEFLSKNAAQLNPFFYF